MVESEDVGGWWRVRMAEKGGSEEGGVWRRMRMVESGGE